MRRLLVAGIGLLVLLRARRPQSVSAADTSDAVVIDNGGHRLPRRRLAVATACVAIGAGLVFVPRHVTPAASAQIDVPVPGALRSVTVRGNRAGTMRASVESGTLGISTAVGERPSHRQYVELVLPIELRSCSRFGRRFGGSCSAATQVALENRDVVVDASQPVLVTLAASARHGFSVEGDGRFATIAVGALRETIRVSCLTPGETLHLMVSGRRALVPEACTPGAETADLHLSLRSRAKPQVDLLAVGALHVEGPAQTATVLAEQPTLRVGNRDPIVLDAAPAAITIAAKDPGQVSIDRIGARGRRSLRVAVPRSESVRLRDRGEQLESLYDRHSDVWLGVAGLVVGIALTQLAEIAVEARAR